MKLLRMKTLAIFGIGFLAGSRAGRGPWENAKETMKQLKTKMDERNGGDAGFMSMTGMDGRRSDTSPQFTQI
jgi:hypothetical protein